MIDVSRKSKRILHANYQNINSTSRVQRRPMACDCMKAFMFEGQETIFILGHFEDLNIYDSRELYFIIGTLISSQTGESININNGLTLEFLATCDPIVAIHGFIELSTTGMIFLSFQNSLNLVVLPKTEININVNGMRIIKQNIKKYSFNGQLWCMAAGHKTGIEYLYIGHSLAA